VFCPNCGMQNPETATTCTKCGFAMKTAAPKFKGTMLMMNQPGASQVPQPRPGSSPAIPPITGGVAPGSSPQPSSGPAFSAEAAPMGGGSGVPSQAGVAGAVGANAPPSRLKGTIVGVAPPKAGAAPGAAAAPPPGAPGTQVMPQQFGQPGVNALGSTVAVGDNGLPPGFQLPDPTPHAPPAAGAPPGAPSHDPAAFGAPPPGGAPGFGGPPPDFGGGAPPGGGHYGAPPQGGGPGGFGAPPQDYGQPQGQFGPPPGAPGGPPGQFGQAPPGGGFGMQQYPGAPMMGPGGGPMMAPTGPGKSWMITLLLCAFGGGVGAHRFYTGHTLYGILQLVTCGGFGVWYLIDFIFILMGKYTDAQGRPLVKT
jgi:TM2 domain-containing membrane protein YozV